MKEKILFWIKKIWPYPLYLILLICLFSLPGQFSRCYPAVSLRFNNGITAEQVDQAARYANDNNVAVSFWQQEKEQNISSDRSSSVCTVISVYGDMQVCYPAEFSSGGFPSNLDTSGCVVSSALAWELWGALNVAGLQLTYGDTTYKVSGVFENKESILMAGIPNIKDAVRFDAAEYIPPEPKNRRMQAEEFAGSSGLGMPGIILDGQVFENIASIASWIPFAIIAAVILFRLFFGWEMRNVKKMSGLKKCLLYGGLLAFAFMLPWLLSLLPAELIPTRWSDFSFWNKLADNQNTYFLQWLGMQPYLQDIAAKELLLKLTVTSLIAIVLAFILINKATKSEKSDFKPIRKE